MKVKLDRKDEYLEAKSLTIEIDNVSYRLSKTIDGRLKINKISIDGNDDYVRVHPSSGNEIDLS